MRSPIVIVLMLSGCAWQSEALRIDENTYRVSANASPMRGGETVAQEMALRAANQKCQQLGKTIRVTDTTITHAFPTNGVATITFECR